MNVYPSRFHQCKVTLNTISPRMKSTPRVEVCCPLATGVSRRESKINIYFKMLHVHFKNTHINPFFDQKSAVFKNKSPVFKNKSAVQKWTVGQVGTHPCSQTGNHNKQTHVVTLYPNSNPFTVLGKQV